MANKIEKLFRAPYSMPNGLQVTDDGIWVVDQITDRVALLEMKDTSEYGVPRVISEIATESSNTSGMTYGGGSLWLTANGGGSRWRPARPTDANTGDSDILRVDPKTGDTTDRYPLPGGGGTHGVEYDHYEDGCVWVQTLKDDVLHKVKISGWSVQHTIPLPYTRGHGMVRVDDGIWVVHTSDRVIVKLDLNDGRELDRIEVPEPHPEPHGLSIFNGGFVYCDATSGWVTKITL